MSNKDAAHPHRPDLQSFGRRKGRKLSPRQDALVADLLPRLRLDLPGTGAVDLSNAFCAQSSSSDGASDSASIADSKRPRDVWLEIGFGGGEHLIWQSTQHRDVDFLGCEPFLDGVVKVLDAVATKGLSNIALYDDDARELLRVLPAVSISRAFILFPDPWPKKKHHKRRLISKVTLDLLARVLKPGAELRIGTDIADYARVILAAILRHDSFNWPAKGPQDWRVRPSDWPQTRYQQKAEREGRSCSYFSFKRADR